MELAGYSKVSINDDLETTESTSFVLPLFSFHFKRWTYPKHYYLAQDMSSIGPEDWSWSCFTDVLIFQFPAMTTKSSQLERRGPDTFAWMIPYRFLTYFLGPAVLELPFWYTSLARLWTGVGWSWNMKLEERRVITQIDGAQTCWKRVWRVCL